MTKKIKSKKITKTNIDRNALALEMKRVEAKKTRDRTRLVQKNDYIKNVFNGEYYLARMNMMADQINNGKIIENIDGCPKSVELMRAEYSLMRMQAINGFRNSNAAKKNLKDSGLSDEDIEAIRLSWYSDKIIQEEQNEEQTTKPKAEFVAE